MATSDSLELLEGFALGGPEDRARVLATLVPGTEPHYRFACLGREQGWADDETLAHILQYEESHPRDSAVLRFQARDVVRGFDAAAPTSVASVAALDTLREASSAVLNHKRTLPRGEQPPDSTPSTLPPSVLDTEKLLHAAMSHAERFTSFITPLAASHPTVLAAAASRATTVHAYVSSYGLPPLPDEEVVAWVATALQDYSSSSPDRCTRNCDHLVNRLNLAQLQLLGAHPQLGRQLLHDSVYVQAMLERLAPPGLVDTTHDTAARDAYTARVGAFIATLPAQFNNLRHTLAYHKLRHWQAEHASLAELVDVVVAYAALPRAGGAGRPLDATRARSLTAAERAAYVSFKSTLHIPRMANPSMSDDQELLSAALTDLFTAGAARAAQFTEHLSDQFVRRVEARAMLLSGAPQSAQYVQAVGGPASVQALVESVMLQLAPNNPSLYSPEQPVVLSVDVKNVSSLLVKVFEVNTTAVYTETAAEVSSAMALDGMIATEELELAFDTPPLTLTRRDIAIPSLASPKRGVFIIDLIGNGVSSRAVIRKGSLHFVERLSVAGHVLRVLDEANNPLPGGRVSAWLSGHYYRANEDGNIVIPYGRGGGGPEPLVLTLEDESASEAEAWGFSSLTSFSHKAESYSLNAGFFVNREALVKDNRSASLVVRPQLLLLGSIPAPLAALENVVLTLTSTDEEGVDTSKVIRDFELQQGRESVVTFPVPYGLRRLSAELTGSVKILATGAKQAVSQSFVTSINEIDATDTTHCAHLTLSPRDGYVLRVLGKTGEPIVNQTLALELHHRLLSRPPTTTLKTDAQGCVSLGQLEDVDVVSVTGGDIAQSFTLFRASCTAPSSVHVDADWEVQVVLPCC